MFRIQNQRDIQQLPHGFAGLVPVTVGEKPEEIVGQAQPGLRPYHRLAVSTPVRRCNHERNVSHESDGFAQVGIVRMIGGVRVGHAKDRHTRS